MQISDESRAAHGGRLAPLRIYAMFAAAMAVLPWLPVSEFIVHLAQSVCYTAIAVIGLNILLGLSGQMSLGQAGFYALGSYGSALTAMRLGWPIPVAIATGTLVAAIGGALVGLFALRTRGLYLAMATMAAGFIVEILSQRWVGLTGGAMGVVGIPQVDGVGKFLAVASTLFILVQIGADYVNDSFIGRRLRAVRESEAFAASVGIRVRWWRATTFAVCAALAGLSGALFAHQSGYVGSDAFTIRLSVSFLIAAVIGGLGTRSGPFLGTVVLLLLVEFLAGVDKYGPMIYGAILLTVLLAFPQGAAGVVGLLKLRRSSPAPRLQDRNHVSREATVLPQLPSGVSLGIANVSKSYAGLKAVDGVSIEVEKGTVHGLIGPNGAGKSTLINLIAGLYRCDAGDIRLGDAVVTGNETAARARLGLARTFQNLQLIEALPAIDNILLGMARHGPWINDFAAWLLHRGHEQRPRQEALAIMRFLGIEEIASRLPGELSYGHRKLVELARAIAQQPSLLLLDEPIAGLNSVEARGIADAICRLRSAGATIVVVEHNMEFVMSICDVVSVLDQGRLLMTDRPAVVKRDPRVIAAYLGLESQQEPESALTWLEAGAQ